MEHEDDNFNWYDWNCPRKLVKETRGIRYQRKDRHYLDCSNVKIGWNTQKSPGDARRLAVTQTSVKDHHRLLAWKTHKKDNNSNNNNNVWKVDNRMSENVQDTMGKWCGPKVSTQKENTEHGLEVRKIYKQKLLRIVSNIGSCTSSTLVLLLPLLVLLLVSGYYYASNIVLEESMMQVSFGLTTESYYYYCYYFIITTAIESLRAGEQTSKQGQDQKRHLPSTHTLTTSVL